MTAAISTDLALHLHGQPLGSAPTLVFLHGLTDSGAGWPEAVQHWQDRYAIVAVDQRGHGASPRFTADQLAGHPGDVMVDDAIEVLEQLPAPVVVMGHSLGGAVALTAAVKRPDLVRAVLLEDPAPLGPDEPQRSERGEEFLADLQESIAAPDDESLLAVRRRQHPNWPESELLVTGRAEQQVDARYLAHGDLKPSLRWPENIAQVAVPTLVVSGDDPDEVVVDAAFEAAVAAVGNPQVRLVRIPGTGHCIRRENPPEYYRVVDEWLEGLGR